MSRSIHFGNRKRKRRTIKQPALEQATGPSPAYMANMRVHMELCDNLAPWQVELVHHFGFKIAHEAMRAARTPAEAWDNAVKALGAVPVRV